MILLINLPSLLSHISTKEYSDGDDEYCPPPLDRYSVMGLIKSNVNYVDDSAFADKEPEEDMSYYCDDEEKGCRGVCVSCSSSG